VKSRGARVGVALGAVAAVAVAATLTLRKSATHETDAGSTAPAIRPALLAASPVTRWDALSAPQKELLSPLQESWTSLPPSEQRAWAELALRFPRLPEQQQSRASTRIQEWATLSPEQRQLARSNYRLAKVLPPDARVMQYEAYRELTPEQRSLLRSAGTVSNTAAAHASPTVGLAKDAAQPFPRNLALRRMPPPAPTDADGNEMLPASQAALATANPESTASGAASSTDAAAIDAPPAGDTSPGNANPAIAGAGANSASPSGSTATQTSPAAN